MVDEQDSKIVCVEICSHIEAMKIECPIAVDTGKVGSCNPFDALFDPSRAPRVEDGYAIEQATT
jgi:hypothetical protein